MRLRIHSGPAPKEVEAPAGANLAAVLGRAGFDLTMSCGGLGACKRCAVEIRSGAFQQDGEPLGAHGPALAPACRVTCGEGPGEVRIPASSLALRQGRILESYRLPPHTLAPAALPATGDGHPLLAVAVDIGTTTVAAVLLDLANGAVRARASMYNQQTRRADDVASRISYARGPTELEELRQLVVEQTVQPLIGQLCAAARARPEQVLRIALAGNTTMMHLFAGLSPATLGYLPFTPVATRFPARPAAELGLRIHPDALADLLPSASAYIGADIVGDLLACGLATGPQPALLVDIGTNGEMVYAEGGRLHACATAAGPAFEGAGLAHGCRAAKGAIEHVRIDDAGELRIGVIGGGVPRGICGSAVVDFLAEGRRSGLLNGFGRLDLDRLRALGRHTEVAAGRGRSHACILAERAQAEDGPITLSEADIAQALKAKAAIQAGIAILLEQCGGSPGALQRLVIAGGFGHFVDLRNAAAIGLLPDVPADRIEVIGNGSLAGAALCLLDRTAAPALDALAAQPEIVELNRIPAFEDAYIESLQLP